jgi:hypothetical protein
MSLPLDRKDCKHSGRNIKYVYNTKQKTIEEEINDAFLKLYKEASEQLINYGPATIGTGLVYDVKELLRQQKVNQRDEKINAILNDNQ